MKQIDYTPFRAEDLARIDVQDRDILVREKYMTEGYEAALSSGISLMAWVEDRCLGAAGLCPINAHKAVAWALMSREVGVYMRPIIRKIQKVIEVSPYVRVEMSVNCDYEAGHMFARLIGMQVEAPRMRKSGVLMDDETLYAMVKHG